MLIIFIRALVLLVTLVVCMRLMGKRQIGEMQPYEFIVTLIIAEVACVPMSDISVPLMYGIIGILAVFIFHQLLTVLEQLSQPMRHIISGKPSVVINKNGVDILELKRNNLGVDDLIESLRNTGNYALDSVSYAIFESNGNLSVLEKQEFDAKESLPILLVSEGKVDKNNLRLAKLGENYIDNFKKQFGIKSLKTIEVLTLDSNGRVYLKEKNKQYRIVNYKLPGGTAW